MRKRKKISTFLLPLSSLWLGPEKQQRKGAHWSYADHKSSGTQVEGRVVQHCSGRANGRWVSIFTIIWEFHSWHPDTLTNITPVSNYLLFFIFLECSPTVRPYISLLHLVYTQQWDMWTYIGRTLQKNKIVSSVVSVVNMLIHLRTGKKKYQCQSAYREVVEDKDREVMELDVQELLYFSLKFS